MFQQPINLGPGTESFSTHTWEIIIMLLIAFILGFLFGYFWYRSRAKSIIEELESEIARLKGEIESLQAALDDCKKSRLSLQAERDGLIGRLSKLEAALAAAQSNDDAVISIGDVGPAIDFDAAFNNENLQVVEGIGPKIESVLKDAGVGSWGSLAATSVDELRSVLLEKSARYRIHDPSSWPEQAKLANNGQWDKLIEYQKFLGGGKEDSSTVGSDLSKIEKMAVKILGITLYKPDDLKLVEGIGPKTELLLKDYGINNWSDLANTTVSQLQQILDQGGSRFRLLDPGTWPEQARMATEGRWKDLDEYQDYLQGGKDLGKA